MNPLAAITLRLLFVYGFYLLLTRLAGKRGITMGKMGSAERQSLGTPLDFVVMLMISDLPDDVIFGEIPVAKGVVAVGTLISLHLLVSFLAFKSPAFRRLVESGPSPLMEHGKMIRKSMRWERLSERELRGELRLVSVDDPSQVDNVTLEPNGATSVERWEDYKPAKRSDLNEQDGYGG